MVTEDAPAKINLCLHVTGQRSDGYHLLDSLVVFAGICDRVTVAQAPTLSLAITGPMAAGLPVLEDNLVLRAARTMGSQGATITLEKHLPVASGIGGGSADAAATLRALALLRASPLPEAAAVLKLGADVPVCLTGHAARMSGVGDIVTALPHPLPAAWLVLVNPGVAVPTPAVFRALTQRNGAPLPQDVPRLTDTADLAGFLRLQRNDLEAAAVLLVPGIAGVKAALGAQGGCLLARMSGSGATCFGLFATALAAEAACRALRAQHPGWWVEAGPVLG